MVLTKETSVSFDADSELVGRYFAERLRRGTGWPVPEAEKGTIRLQVIPDSQKSLEAYSLQITTTGITIRAASPAGVVRGTETLLQLMPPAVYGAGKFETLTLPALTITDAPQFAWRGALLDVARKFRDKNAILKLLDGMASCKLNVFHWHLTDDEGWRLPIDGYPKLTGKGPAYSRADIQEVVQRAAQLGIMIVPEIEMPGHSGAGCRAYPEIAVENSMNPGADATYRFIEAAVKDVAVQFPNSPYFAMGADEVLAGAWNKDPQCQALMEREHLKGAHELFVYFVNRVVAIAKSHGKRCVAWDEAFDPKNDPSLIIVDWRGMPAGIAAAKAGREVVFSPNPSLYINHANTRSKQNPRGFSAHTAYLNPIYFFHSCPPAIPAADRHNIYGGEVCLWGEYVEALTPPMFPMMFPRACAMGENLWTPRDRLDWPDFLKRLEVHLQRLAALKIPYFWEPETLAMTIGTWGPGDVAAKKGVMEFSLDGKLQNAGEQEFFVAQTTGNGQFRVQAAELLKDGVVVDTDRHRYDSAIYKGVEYMYVLKNPDVTGRYAVRFHVTPLAGDCSAIVQLIPALASGDYSKQCAPGSGANRTKQLPAP